jgi:hypothetical protein
MLGRNVIPVGIHGDPVVDRKDQRVFTSLSKPSPLHKTPDTNATSGVSQSIARILDSTRDADGDDDDLTFLDRLTQAAQPFPKFPMLREGELGRFQTQTIRHTVSAPLAAWRDPSMITAAVWRDLWWANAGHRRVICNITSVEDMRGTEASVPSKGEQLLKMDVAVDVVTCEIESQGLATARVVSVVAPARKQQQQQRQADDNADDDGGRASTAVNASGAESTTSAQQSTATTGLLVRLLRTSDGFGARDSEDSEAASTVFVRAAATTIADLAPGNKVMLTVELSTAILHAARPSVRQDGEWSVVTGTVNPCRGGRGRRACAGPSREPRQWGGRAEGCCCCIAR